MNVFTQFNDVSAENGIYTSSFLPFHGSGCSFVDFDGDGLDDITFLQNNTSPVFYKNTGNGFIPQGFAFIPNIDDYVDGKTWLWFDFDNDGLKDFLYSQHFQGVQLYKNQGNNVFLDVTDAAQINVPYSRCMGVAAGDYDRNGFLDFFICKFHNHNIETDLSLSNQLFRNNGDGTFTDVTVSSGIGLSIQASFMPVFSDFNRDGWQDIYIVNDKVEAGNYVYLNNGDGTFINVSDSSGAGVHLESMCGTIEDYDNDNDLDIFVSNNHSLNALLENQGDATFSDISLSSGLNGYDPGGAFWGSVWIDFDNNTLQDLLVCEIAIVPGSEANNDLFINNGDDTFTLVTEDFGINMQNERSYCVAMGDINADGYPDVIINNQYPSTSDLWLNEGGENHFMTVNLTGTSSNRDGIGTFIDLWFGGKQYTRYTHCGEGFLSQNSNTEFFGMGEHVLADSLRLTWLSGLVETYYRIPADQHLKLTEGEAQSASLNVSGFAEICPQQQFTLQTGSWLAYSWSNGNADASIENPLPGNYHCLVTDVYGNQFLSDTLNLSYHPELQYSALVTPVSCFDGQDGEVDFQFFSSGQVEILFAGMMIEGAQIDGLSSGVYGYALLDQFNCWTNGLIHVEHPEPISVNVSSIDANCHGESTGAVSWEITGGVGPYVVSGDFPGANELVAGQYSIYVVDAHDCVASQSFEISEPAPISFEVNVIPVSCYGESSGVAEVTIWGGTGILDIHWNNLDSTHLAAGDYTVLISDEHDCVVEMLFSVTEPDPLQVQLETSPEYEGQQDGMIEGTASGGTPPYAWQWSTGSLSEGLIDELISGYYTLTLSDANGCSLTQEVFVDMITALDKHDTDVFSIFPNPAREEVFVKKSAGAEFAEIIIYNAIGEAVMKFWSINNPERISIVDFPPGLYQITVNTTITNQSATMIVR